MPHKSDDRKQSNMGCEAELYDQNSVKIKQYSQEISAKNLELNMVSEKDPK